MKAELAPHPLGIFCHKTAIVTGAEDFADDSRLDWVLDALRRNPHFGIARIVTGLNTGADYLARVWAYSRDVPVILCENPHSMMERNPDYVVTFCAGPEGPAAQLAALAREHCLQIVEFL